MRRKKMGRRARVVRATLSGSRRSGQLLAEKLGVNWPQTMLVADLKANLGWTHHSPRRQF